MSANETETRAVSGPHVRPRASPEVDADDLLQPAPGEVVGRYTVLGLLGRGGMGAVYKAYDPQLDRNVAIKLLRRIGSPLERSEQRLLREAQLLARLQHPNVVAVFDAGLTERGVFIAMELCEGRTLSEWLEAAPRTTAEILAVFRAAGRGLVAVHQAGFVHRDFKPSNVLVGQDGSVRVLDFGIASLVDPAGAQLEPTTGSRREVARPPGVAEALSTSGASPLLTDDGLVVGTPMFMAPEQIMGEKADHRSEQFSFCLCLHQALYGSLPVLGRTFGARRLAMALGRALDPELLLAGPTRGAVSGRVRRAIVRGLQPDPAARFDSMQALLDELEPPTRRWPFVVAGLSLVSGLAAWVVAFSPADPCAHPEAALAGVWSPDDREAVRAAYAGSGHAQAPMLHAPVQRALDDYAAAWTAMYAESCRATFVAKRQSELLHGHRMRCLERRRDRLRAAIDSLAAIAAPREAIDRTLLPFMLPPLAECADLDAVMASGALPDEPAARERVAELRRRIDELRTLQAAGELREGLRRAPAVVDDARATGFSPVLAEALCALGSLQVMGGSAREAQATLEASIREAARAKDDVVAAEAWTWLLLALLDRHELERGLGLELAAEAAVERADDDRMRGWLLNNLGALYSEHGDPVRARRHLQDALDIKARTLGPAHVDVGISWVNLGMALTKEHLHAEARHAFEQARVVFERTVGMAHPLTYYALGNLCLVEEAEARYARAVELCGQVLEHFEASPSSNVIMGNTHFLMARALWGAGQAERARAQARRALALVWADAPELAREVAAWMEAPPGLRPASERASEGSGRHAGGP